MMRLKPFIKDDYNEAAVSKITGQSDKVQQLIRRYKNEKYPTIAIIVDLLTTGIDVPTICNLVFLRRVRSRILFEQMLGRATRCCDEIGKTDKYGKIIPSEFMTVTTLAKAFRGELTADWRAQNPDLISGENSASALLAKIKAERETLATTKKTGKKLKA